jgi:hypothetical protein
MREQARVSRSPGWRINPHTGEEPKVTAAAVRKLTVALVALSSIGCQSPTGPAEPEPAPRPAPALRHNADVILRRIDVIGACDGKDLFGDPRKGQFSYRIGVRDNPIAGSAARYILESEDYGDVLGQTFLRGPGESIDLNDRTYTFLGLSDRESLTISFAGIEWDIVARDDDMKGDTAQQSKTHAGDGTTYYENDLGSGSCKIQLEYAINWTTP